MRILFVTPQPPWPPTQGTALRNYHLLAAAAGEHEVDLLTFGPSDPPGASGGLGPLGDLCQRIEVVPPPARSQTRRLLDLALGYADMERRLWSASFAAQLEAMLRTGAYDAVQLEGFEVAGYLLGPGALRAEAAQRCAPRPRLIFDDHNAEYELQASAARIDARIPARWPRAAYSAVQARRLRAREALYCAAADLCLAVSQEDAAALERLVPGLDAVVVPNGVACDAVPPPWPAPVASLFFAGKLVFRPNVYACEWLVRHILPAVRARVPAAHVVLAGRDPAPAVRRLAGPAVEVTGALDDEALARRRAEAWVCVVPVRMGSGVRFKVLEAMAGGVPLVTTPLGAAGTGIVDGEHALLAADASSFARAVVSLLEQPERRARLAAAARALAAARHDWRQVTPRLLDAYRHLRPASGGVSVITTLLNERGSVTALLHSLAAQSRPPDEVVVADGGSVDGTREVLARRAAAAPSREGSPFPLRLIDVRGANISQGRNAAIRAASHDLIAATDGGVVLHPAWLERLAGVLERSPALQVASGFFVAAPETTWERALGAATLPLVEEIRPARFLPSSRSVAFRREAWRRAGGYPAWLDYCEDLVFDLRLRAQSGPLRFVPRAVVRFRPRPSPRAFFLQYYRYARGDGKADLWRKRHAIRYGAYATGAALLWQALAQPVRRWPALAALLAGGAIYLSRPLVRLAHLSGSGAEFCRAVPLVPFIVVLGDVAKMVGYPVGVSWRLRQYARRRLRAPAHDTDQRGDKGEAAVTQAGAIRC